MKAILRIGFTEILLPSAVGVEAVIKALGRGVECSNHLYRGEVEIREKDLKIELTMVPESTRFTSESGEAVITVTPFPAGGRKPAARALPKGTSPRPLPPASPQLRLVG